MEAALDDDNLLAEFLLRLPPLPSSLPRASLVCKRWHRLVSDPQFIRRFRSHHKKAPVLGFIYDSWNRSLGRFSSRSIGFISTLDSPNRIPAPRFALQLDKSSFILDCHHGLVLVYNLKKQNVHVWDPVTRDHRCVAQGAFDGTNMFVVSGVVLCAVKDQRHVHGACHSYPFRVVLVGQYMKGFCFSVYSSETGAWGNSISLPWSLSGTMILGQRCSGTLIGNSVCWLVYMYFSKKVKILQYDLDEQKLAYIDVPSYVSDINDGLMKHDLAIMPVGSGGIDLIDMNGFTVRIWKRISNGTFAARWTLRNSFDLSNLLSLRPSRDVVPVLMLALDEDGNVLFKLEDSGVVFTVHLGSMLFKKLTGKIDTISCHPFTSYSTPGT